MTCCRHRTMLMGEDHDMKFMNYPSRVDQAKGLAEIVSNQLKTAISQTGVARVAVSGGSTPQAFLGELDKIQLPWESVRLTMTDERQVPADNPRSNLHFIRTCLPTVSERLQLVPLYEPVDGMMDFAALADVLRKSILPLDVCVLGMGEDGHFASLFPGADLLAQGLDPDNDAPVLPIQAPTAAEARISLTMSALLTAPSMHLLIQGKAKKEVLDAAVGGRSDLPIASLLKLADARLVVHYAD